MQFLKSYYCQVKKQNIWLGNLNNTGYVKTKFILTKLQVMWVNMTLKQRVP
jgi:hypothetical protein